MHQCFIQHSEDPEEREDHARTSQLLRWRSHLRQQQRATNDDDDEETKEEEEDKEYHPPVLLVWDTDAQQETSVHVPNMVVSMTSDDEDDSAPHIFDQADCIEQFLNYLDELTEKDARYVKAITHKGTICTSLFNT